MRKILNCLLILSCAAFLILAGLLYHSYRKSKAADTTLLEMNASMYQNPIQLKEGRVEDTALNLIFYTSEDGRELKEVSLEVLNGQKGTLSYINIPLNTEVAIEAPLYQKLAAISPDAPQYFQLFRLAELFDEDKRYAYGQLILDQMFCIDSSYYTVAAGEEAGYREHCKNLVKSSPLQSEDDIIGLMKKEYHDIQSNLPKKKMLQYAKVYAKVQADAVTEKTADGVSHTDSFTVDLGRFSLTLSDIKSGV